MEIRHWGVQSPEAIDQFLERSLTRRLTGHHLEEDFVIVYEPTEVFSAAKEEDFFSIRSATEEEFWRYKDERDVPLIMIRRGGGMMWHGPGQVCLAPLMNLTEYCLDGSSYPALLEETCLRTLKHFGVTGRLHHYCPGANGVWVDDKKIAFFGSSSRPQLASDGVTMLRQLIIHGAAINVSPNLYPFSLIDPCNLKGVEVTSMKEVLGDAPLVKDVGQIFIREFLYLLNRAAQK